MKYKIYDKQNKIIYTTFVSLCPDGSIIYLNEQGTWEEDTKERFCTLPYSDVKDVNGDEIYAGMKVKCLDQYIGDIFVKGETCDVIFSDGQFSIICPQNPLIDALLDECAVNNSGIIIIGWSVPVDHEI